MSQLSIIIPALSGIERMEEGLVSVLQHRPAHAQVVVVLNQPYNDPWSLSDEVCWVHAPRRTRLADALNLGLAESDGDVVHFLASGSEVAADWCEGPLEALAEPDVAAVAPLIVAPAGNVLGVDYVPGGARQVCTSTDEHLQPGNVFGPSIDAAFYRRDVIVAAGGVATSLGDQLVDVDLALAFRRAGYRAEVRPDSQVALHAAMPPRVGAVRRGLYAERLFRRNQALARRAGSHVAAVLKHPSLWAGRMLAQLDSRPRLQQQRLARLAQQRAASAPPATVPFRPAAEESSPAVEPAPLRKSA